ASAAMALVAATLMAAPTKHNISFFMDLTPFYQTNHKPPVNGSFRFGLAALATLIPHFTAASLNPGIR
ncbi:MAG: hypothetical protein OIF35_09780, partial [Cellvibrionaceae bacterium]|nr:hypothetical protein [Cellvibrionaceae bacterium]